MKMKQQQLVDLLHDRGWRIKRSLKDLSPSRRTEAQGISIHALSQTGYILSIQAGEGYGSMPRCLADEYDSVEFAIWKDHDHGRPGQYIEPDGTFSRDSGVTRFAYLEELLDAISNIESWIKGNEPVPVPRCAIQRNNAPYKDVN